MSAALVMTRRRFISARRTLARTAGVFMSAAAGIRRPGGRFANAGGRRVSPWTTKESWPGLGAEGDH